MSLSNESPFDLTIIYLFILFIFRWLSSYAKTGYVDHEKKTAGDWLQGPYVYYLYSQYGFGKGEIGHLFIAGFGSSMLFGTIVGSLADKK